MPSLLVLVALRSKKKEHPAPIDPWGLSEIVQDVITSKFGVCVALLLGEAAWQQWIAKGVLEGAFDLVIEMTVPKTDECETWLRSYLSDFLCSRLKDFEVDLILAEVWGEVLDRVRYES